MSNEVAEPVEAGRPAAPAKNTTRFYTVLEQIAADQPGTFQQIARVKAADEKEARWKAVDGNPELAERVADPEKAVILVAISERNWIPKETTEVVVTKATRA